MTLLFHLRKLVFLVAFLPVAIEIALAQELLPHECEQEQVLRCYADYRQELLKDAPHPDDEDEGFRNWCRAITNKSRCHQRVELCPAEVRSNSATLERGYEALRDIICDEKSIRELYTARSCLDHEKWMPCLVQHMKDVTPENTKDPACNISEAGEACYEMAFTLDCSMPLKSAKAAVLKADNAIRLLLSCNGGSSDGAEGSTNRPEVASDDYSGSRDGTGERPDEDR